MKKVYVALLMVVCLLLSGCAAMQAEIVDSMEEMYGIEGKTYEEHKAYYQAQWDAFFAEFGKLFDTVADEAEEAVKDAIDEAIDEAESEIKDAIDDAQDIWTDDSVDWENITAQDKVTPATIKDEDGYTDCYDNKFPRGQCTWYAYGRMQEKTGIEMDVSGNAKEWINTTPNDEIDVETDLTKIKPNSVAVFHKPADPDHWGHVVYIEHVTYDENGNPDKVYFTECNMDAYTLKDGSKNPKWGVYNEGDDCIVKSADYEDFISRSGGAHQCLGYLIPKK